MINIAIDIGSYSVKFLTYSLDKKIINHISTSEVVIDLDQINIMEENAVADLQTKIINDFLSNIDQEYKVIVNAPNEILSTRFLTIPNKSKKKASMMLSFMLEEEVPYSLADSHISSAITVKGKECEALVNICKAGDFQEIINKFNEYKIKPDFMTSEVSAINTFVRNSEHIWPQAFAILDIGHKTTKAYYFVEQKLVATHTSYIAGESINESISKNYNISIEEAAIYKHQNCFVLAKEQYDEVNDDQKAFAEIMDKTLSPLISEIQRWNIGFRVQNGLPLEDIYITGGSANIKNILNYLESELVLKVSSLNSYEFVSERSADKDAKLRRKFDIPNMLAYSLNKKSSSINFLTGDFAIHGKADLPFRSYSFFLTRISAIIIILCLSFSVEMFFTSKNITSADKTIKGLLKNSNLALTKKEQRAAVKKNKQFLSKLNRRSKTIRQTISTLQSSVKVNALSSLEYVAGHLSSDEFEVIHLKSVNQGDFQIKVKGKTKKSLETLVNNLESSSIPELFIDKKLSQKIIIINGVDL